MPSIKPFKRFLVEAAKEVKLGPHYPSESVDPGVEGPRLAAKHKTDVAHMTKKGKSCFVPASNTKHPSLAAHEHVGTYEHTPERVDLQANQADRYFKDVKKRGY